MRVREFTRAESIALLRRLVPDLTKAEADRVAEAVGDLPLAVEQAGSLLADTGMTADKYLRLLAERAEDVLDHDPGGAYPQSLAASWAVAFDRLAADDPTALDLLRLVAWCGSEPVPLSLLTEHPDALPDPLRPIATDPLVLARCTAILHRRGMATVSPHGIQLHRIPAALLRARSQGSAPRLRVGRRPWSGCSTRPRPPMCAPIRAAGRSGDGCCRCPGCGRSRRRLDAVPADATRLLDRAATYLFIRGELQAALAAYERAYEVRREDSVTSIRTPSPRPATSL